MQPQEIDKTIEKYGKGAVYLGESMWANPAGRTLIILAAGLVGLGLLGVGFRVAAFTMNGYKDYAAAAKR